MGWKTRPWSRGACMMDVIGSWFFITTQSQVWISYQNSENERLYTISSRREVCFISKQKRDMNSLKISTLCFLLSIISIPNFTASKILFQVQKEAHNFSPSTFCFCFVLFCFSDGCWLVISGVQLGISKEGRMVQHLGASSGITHVWLPPPSQSVSDEVTWFFYFHKTLFTILIHNLENFLSYMMVWLKLPNNVHHKKLDCNIFFSGIEF